MISIGIREESGEGRREEGTGELGKERFQNTGDEVRIVGLRGREV